MSDPDHAESSSFHHHEEPSKLLDASWDLPDSLIFAKADANDVANGNLIDDHPRTPSKDQAARARSSKKKNMDPFEVRLRFTQLLQTLNASVTSANKTAQYALKYRDMDEDLHSCIIEQLERNGMNVRANIMYFIEHLCDIAEREGHESYVRMMQRDIFQIIDAVAPEDGSGAANIKVVRKVLQGLQARKFLLELTVTEIEEVLKARDVQPDASSPSQVDTEMSDIGNVRPTGGRSVAQLDKKQIEQRIEEDRERHKRAREHIWAIPAGGEDAEFQKLWDETSDIGDDDYLLYEEEAAAKAEAVREWMGDHNTQN